MNRVTDFYSKPSDMNVYPLYDKTDLRLKSNAKIQSGNFINFVSRYNKTRKKTGLNKLMYDALPTLQTFFFQSEK